MIWIAAKIHIHRHSLSGVLHKIGINESSPHATPQPMKIFPAKRYAQTPLPYAQRASVAALLARRAASCPNWSDNLLMLCFLSRRYPLCPKAAVSSAGCAVKNGVSSRRMALLPPGQSLSILSGIRGSCRLIRSRNQPFTAGTEYRRPS